MEKRSLCSCVPGNRVVSMGKLEVSSGLSELVGIAVARLKLELRGCSGRETDCVPMDDVVFGAMSCERLLLSEGRLRLFGCLTVKDSPVTWSICRGGYVQLELARQLGY